MYTKEQKERALKEFERLGSVQAVVTLLGYPSRHTLYDWYRNKIADIADYHGSLDKEYQIKQKYINAPNHPRNPDANLKLDAIKRCFSLGEGVEYVSRDIGYSRASIYSWYRKYQKFGVAGLMSSKKQIKRENIDFNTEPSKQQEISELQEQIKQLQMEVDVLKEALNLLKKDPGINITELKNREKAVIIDAVEDKYSLHQLLKCLCMAKSSYYYQRAVMKQSDKYAEIRIRIKIIFQENRNCYGYRRIHGELKKIGITVSEKIVRRIMKEEHLTVPTKRMKKYSSYKGEITPEVDNIINRDFHAEQPNTKWLTDITEFAIPAGKVYLSPVIDCFDGMVVKWNIGTTPDSILVNKMLEDAIGTLLPSEHPLVHTDRGCHYRWTGWIERMQAAGLTRSMSKKGCSPDNAACEGFFGRLKNEMFYGRSWVGVSMDDFINEINSYIEWYNTKRIKQSLGYMSPAEYRHSLGLTA
ncbi:MAG: IS3 family transposase [Clostridia bacterium]|jgi:putative transposase|nr:IS3 family transposase [Firmicutes bacterium AF36-3BH]